MPFTGTNGRRLYDYIFVPVIGADGEVEAVAGTTRDVTERKAAERAVQAGEERLRTALAAARMVAWEWTPADRKLRVSENAADVFGLPAGVGLTGIDQGLALLHPDDVAAYKGTFQKAIADRTGYLTRYRLVRPDDGRVIWIEERGQTVFDQPDDGVRLFGVAMDVTDRRQAEEAVARLAAEAERERRLFAAVLSNTPDFIYTFDLDGRFVYVNTALLALWGKTLDEAVGRNFFDLDYPPDLADRLQRQIQQVIDTRQPIRDETPYTSGVGERMYEYIFAPVLGAGDVVEAVAGSTRDITDRKLAEAERERLVGQLRDQDRRKDEFLATLAHELRNPLAPIRNGLQVIRLAGADGTDRAGPVDDGAATRPDDPTGGRPARREPGDERQAGTPQEAGRTAGGDRRRRRDEPPGHRTGGPRPRRRRAGRADLRGRRPDPARPGGVQPADQLRQVHPPGRAHPAVGRRETTTAAVVTVTDDGIGIPPAMLEAVFEMFTQVDRTLEKTTGGLGIGLSLVKGLVEMHGGTIEARSEGEGRGSEFTVRLPVATSAASESEPRRTTARSASCRPVLRRILVVDDNVDSAESLAQLLDMLGNEVRTAYDGEAGVEAARAFRPDVVLCDIGMPKMNGYDVARRIRAEPWGQNDRAGGPDRVGAGGRPAEECRRRLRPPPGQAGRCRRPDATVGRLAGDDGVSAIGGFMDSAGVHASMKALVVAGARPNFVKVAPLLRALRAAGHESVLVHTGQHYDDAMSGSLFHDLAIAEPDHHLGVGSGTHAAQTARIMERFEPVLVDVRPDWVVVVGDVNSTLACALVAAKLRADLGCRIAHVEAGLRSGDWTMPEEVNRVLTDRLCDLLLTPSADAAANLFAEGIDPMRVATVGNVMIDTLFLLLTRARTTALPPALSLERGTYAVATLHRPSTVDDPQALAVVLEALAARRRDHAAGGPAAPTHAGESRTLRVAALAASTCRTRAGGLHRDALARGRFGGGAHRLRRAAGGDHRTRRALRDAPRTDRAAGDDQRRHEPAGALAAVARRRREHVPGSNGRATAGAGLEVPAGMGRARQRAHRAGAGAANGSAVLIDLWCALDCSATGWGRRFVTRALDAAASRPRVEAVTILDQPDVLLAGRRRSDQTSCLSAGDDRLIVLGTVCDDLSRRAGRDGFDWDSLCRDPPSGLYHLLLWRPAARELRVSSDVVGARPLYYWGRDGRFVLSTTLEAFRGLPGGAPGFDPHAIAETLTLCHPLDDRTLLAGVAHVPASHALVFAASGIERQERRDAWSAPVSEASWSLEDSADALDAALDRSVRVWSHGHERVDIALTGGVDSRLLLPCLRARVAHVQACTFGEPRSLEVLVARQLCAETGTAHDVCELRDDETLASDELASFAAETEWLGDSAGPFYWRRWLAFVSARGLPLASGYLGDVLGGHRLLSWGVPRGALEGPALAASDDLARHPASAGSTLIPFARTGFRDEIGHEVGERLADVYAHLPGERAYRRLLALDLSQRQRRYIGWFPEVCEEAVPVLSPYLSTDVMETVARMPFASLFNRAAVHVVLERRMPGAMRHVDANTGRRLVHATRWQACSDAMTHNRYTRRIAAWLGMPERLVLSTFQRLIRAQRDAIAAELETHQSMLAELIDLRTLAAAVRADRGPTPYQAMRVYNVATFVRRFQA